jgi:hypothetical protein
VVWVSIIGGVAGAVSALISGVLKYAQDRRVERVIIVVSDRRIEVPIGTPPELIREYVSAIKDVEVQEIVLW